MFSGTLADGGGNWYSQAFLLGSEARCLSSCCSVSTVHPNRPLMTLQHWASVICQAQAPPMSRTSSSASPPSTIESAPLLTAHSPCSPPRSSPSSHSSPSSPSRSPFSPLRPLRPPQPYGNSHGANSTSSTRPYVFAIVHPPPFPSSKTQQADSYAIP